MHIGPRTCTRPSVCIPGTPEPNVAVRIAGSIVQIQRLYACIAAIVPIPAARKKPTRFRFMCGDMLLLTYRYS